MRTKQPKQEVQETDVRNLVSTFCTSKQTHSQACLQDEAMRVQANLVTKGCWLEQATVQSQWLNELCWCVLFNNKPFSPIWSSAATTSHSGLMLVHVNELARQNILLPRLQKHSCSATDNRIGTYWQAHNSGRMHIACIVLLAAWRTRALGQTRLLSNLNLAVQPFIFPCTLSI